MNPSPRNHVVLIVIYTLAITAIMYVSCLSYCLIKQLPVSETLGGAFTHVGDTVIGGLLSLLVRTSSDATPEKPQAVEVKNTAAEPVPTAPQKP